MNSYSAAANTTFSNNKFKMLRMCQSMTVTIIITTLTFLVFVDQTESTLPLKRSFVHLGCMGKYDRVVFAKLDKVCQDCYNLYREPGLHSECRKNCFKNSYFDGCRQTLLVDTDDYDTMVNSLYGSS